MKKLLKEPSELDGYDELKPEDQAKIIKAWQEGKVDVPESARKHAAAGDEDEGDEELRKMAIGLVI